MFVLIVRLYGGVCLRACYVLVLILDYSKYTVLPPWPVWHYISDNSECCQHDTLYKGTRRGTGTAVCYGDSVNLVLGRICQQLCICCYFVLICCVFVSCEFVLVTLTILVYFLFYHILSFCNRLDFWICRIKFIFFGLCVLALFDVTLVNRMCQHI